MTLPPSKIGDKGQRYEIRFTRKALDEQLSNPHAPKRVHTLGWTKTYGGAQEMRDAWKTNPEIDNVWIVDRRKPPHPAGAKHRVITEASGKTKIIFA